MSDMFGGKWERENGRIGEEKFYSWVDHIENLEPSKIRAKFTLLEQKFKKDVSDGKDIWPPTLAYFMALNATPRINEGAYKQYTPKLSPHTHQEYIDMGERGMEKIRSKTALETIEANQAARDAESKVEEKNNPKPKQSLQEMIENAAMVANRYGTPMDEAQRLMGMTEEEVNNFIRN